MGKTQYKTLKKYLVCKTGTSWLLLNIDGDVCPFSMSIK